MPRPGSCLRQNHLTAATRSGGLGMRSPGIPSGTHTPTGLRAGTRAAGFPPERFRLPVCLPACLSACLSACLPASPIPLFQPTLGATLTPETGGRPGALPRPETGGGATHQDQAPALPLGLGQGTSTHRSLQPESRDSPRRPIGWGPLAVVADNGGSETRGGCRPLASRSAAKSGSSSPAATENPEDDPTARV